MQAVFTPIDLAAWPRWETYHYYHDRCAPVCYTINKQLDVSAVKTRGPKHRL